MINTHDGYFSPEISVYKDIEVFYRRLIRLLNANNIIPEIVIHPKDSDDPETRIFSEARMVELLKDHEIINYHNLNGQLSGRAA